MAIKDIEMEDNNLKTLFQSAEKLREIIESAWDVDHATQQTNINITIDRYEKCLKLADQLALFSPNETLEDLTTDDLQYLLIHYRIAELINRITHKDRRSIIQRAREAIERYIQILDQYDILSPEEKKLHERYIDSPTTFSTISSRDPNAQRDARIARFKFEKTLEFRLQFLAQIPAYLEHDDDTIREFHLTQISLCTHRAFQELGSLNRELEVLSMAPPSPPASVDSLERDYRDRMDLRGKLDESSWRLDRQETISVVNRGPILSSSGKPLRPFTLLDSRQTLKKNVFRSGHNLPTMTIDEYIEEERARGGIIDGGGEASGLIPEPDEDNHEKADNETMKAREWDEFKEENQRGSGNTLNRG